MDVTKRNTALDITRIVALFTVISVHFFLNNGFYGETVRGWEMYVMTVMRSGFMVCVPLFITLTGYLMCRKTFCAGYYRGIVKTLAIYVLASFACLIFKVVCFHYSYSAESVLFGVLGFSAANYSWYIEMYIGLFLLIPFINLMYNGLPTKKAKLALVGTLLLLSSLPSIFNIYNFYRDGWWANPRSSAEYQQILPDWWTMLYPFTYYFIGAFLREFPAKMKKRWNLLLLIGAVLLFGSFNYYRSYGGDFIWAKYNDWYGLPNVIMTTLLFIFLSERNTGRFPMWLKKLLAHLSDLCLGAYLVSYIFDRLIYSELVQEVPLVESRLVWYLPVVLVVFLLSLLLSLGLNLLYGGLSKLCAAAYIRIPARVKRSMPQKAVIPALPQTPPVLETERLRLRPWRADEAEALFAMAGDCDVADGAGWKPHETMDDSQWILKKILSGSCGLVWALESREDGRVIGTLELHKTRRRLPEQGLELGYMLARSEWGKGLMTEAAGRVLCYAFGELGLERVTATHFDGNERSRRVLEKLGFTFRGRSKKSWKRWDGGYLDENVYVLTADCFAGDGCMEAAAEILRVGE